MLRLSRMPARAPDHDPQQSVGRLAAAKINLALHVLGRRADGYHDLDTLAVFADIGDDVCVSPADDVRLRIDGPMAGHAPSGADNLVLRAAELLKAHARVDAGAMISLRKGLPSGAGLGGGSADAAAALHALNEFWGIGLSPAALSGLGEKLGADLAMCLASRALRAGGIGERIELRAGWPPLPLVLVWPARPVSTPAVFARLARRENPPLPIGRAFDTVEALAEWLMVCRNDLEAPAKAIAPEIGDALAAINSTRDCLLGRMSGSGSACFGLYPGMEAAERAATALASARPGWWVAATLAR